MKKKTTFWSKLSGITNMFFLIVGCVCGIVGSYLLGHVFNMGFEGYAIGFIVGFGIGYGVLAIEL